MLVSYRSFLLILVSLVFLLVLKKPVEWLLLHWGMESTRADLLAGIIDRVLIVTLALGVLFRYGFGRVNGLTPRPHIQHVQALLVPVAIISMVFFSNWSIYLAAAPDLLLLFVFSVGLVGLVEELVFRGLLLPLLIKKGWKLPAAVLFTAFLFGLTHYLNLFRQPDNLSGINGQVLFALCIGSFFGGLLLRTGNILPVAFLHGFFNFSFGTGILKEEKISASIRETSTGVDWGDLAVLLIYGFILGSGLLMAFWTDRRVVEEKVRDIRI